MTSKGHVLGSGVASSATSTNMMTGSQSGGASNSVPATTYQEFSVRVPKLDKPMSVMRFNGALNVDLAKWTNLKMIRDDHTTRKTVDHTSTFEQAEMPKFGAGSEYGREAREEARRRKYGQHKKKVNADDHPWVLKATTPTDKQPKRFKGIREGTISSNASYFVFTQATDGQFEVFPVSQWYNFTPVQTYKALSAEEAEEEFGRRDKIMNYFSVMIKKRIKCDEADGGDKDEEKKKGRGGGGGGGGLKVSEMEDWDDVNEMESEDDDEDEGPKDKKKKKGPANKKKKKKGSDSEANEDSDDGDGEGRELDYISDSSMSSSDDEEGGKKLDLAGVDQESGLRNLLESDSSEEEQKEEKPEEETEEGEKNKGKVTKKTKKAKKKSNEEKPSSAVENLSDGDSDSDDSDSEKHEVEDTPKSSPVAVEAKEKTPEVVEGDAENRKRKITTGSLPPPKKNKLEVSSVLLQTAASEGITEEAVRRYLLRKPMTVTGLLQKFKNKKNSISSDDMVTIIASILKKINPTKRNQNSKMYLFLKG